MMEYEDENFILSKTWRARLYGVNRSRTNTAICIVKKAASSIKLNFEYLIGMLRVHHSHVCNVYGAPQGIWRERTESG